MIEPKDIVSTKSKSGYRNVYDTHKGKRPKPYMASKKGGPQTRWTGPCRATAHEAAQDYCDYVNGHDQQPAFKLISAGHVRVRDGAVTTVTPVQVRVRQERPVEGYVYCISDGTALKIGKTNKHPSNRIAELQTGNPRLLKLLAFKYVDDMAKGEVEMHRLFSHLNVLGEWFEHDTTILTEFGYTEEG